MFNFKSRINASGLHFSISLVVALCVSSFVILIWYPWPFSAFSGGLRLIAILVVVDVILGPTLTFFIFDINKTKKQLFLDVLIICFIQVCGMAYGLHTIYAARPIAVVYEGSRFRVVTAIQINPEDKKRLEQFNFSIFMGPQLLGTRSFLNENEKNEAIDHALAGIDIGLRPQFWQEYKKSKASILQNARPIEKLIEKYPSSSEEILNCISKAKLPQKEVFFTPVITRSSDWVILLNGRNAEKIGYLELDGFFE